MECRCSALRSVRPSSSPAPARGFSFVALWSVPGWWYVAVNAAAAFFAYVLIVNFDFEFNARERRLNGVFRSSLFSLKVGETDAAVGPAILFQVLLFAPNRARNRKRARNGCLEAVPSRPLSTGGAAQLT